MKQLNSSHQLNLGSIDRTLDQDSQLNFLGGLMEYLCSLVPNNYIALNEFLEISTMTYSGMQENIHKQCLVRKKGGYTEKTGYAIQLVSSAFELAN